jgi:hypothetical protein
LRGILEAVSVRDRNNQEPLLRTPIVPVWLSFIRRNFHKVVAAELNRDRHDDSLKNTSISTKTGFHLQLREKSPQSLQNGRSPAFPSLSEKLL